MWDTGSTFNTPMGFGGGLAIEYLFKYQEFTFEVARAGKDSTKRQRRQGLQAVLHLRKA